MNKYCVIMAGGVGSRFWPLSRTSKPKQFLDISGNGESLLQSTYKRFRKILPADNIIIVTSIDYETIVKEQLPEVTEKNILMEPLRRNTAPCIAYATYRIQSQDPEALIVVAPSDHLIIREDDFLNQVNEGFSFVSSGEALLTMGIKPDRPETGYGYIQINGSSPINAGSSQFWNVKTFTEKPNLELARKFIESGEFYWNSGIFFWSAQSILNAIEKYLPEINSVFKAGIPVYETTKEKEFIQNAYSLCNNVSIDYGVMEKADNVFVLTSDFGWSDLGSWGSLFDLKEKDPDKNAIIGDNVFLYDVKNSLISVPEGKLMVLQGLDNFIVVESDDILLICHREEEQRIKQFINDVKISKGEKYG